MIQKGIIFFLVFTRFWHYGALGASWADEVVPGMVLIPAGEFEMGRADGISDEKPVHTVYVDAFYMDIHEVTNAEYKKFIDANPQWQKDRIARRLHDGTYLRPWSGNDYPPGRGDYPVNYVSWYAAMAYAKWAGKRLPTEAEWEKAARGGLVGKGYPWGGLRLQTQTMPDISTILPPLGGMRQTDMVYTIWREMSGSGAWMNMIRISM